MALPCLTSTSSFHHHISHYWLCPSCLPLIRTLVITLGPPRYPPYLNTLNLSYLQSPFFRSGNTYTDSWELGRGYLWGNYSDCHKWFSTLAEHQNHMESFKILMPRLRPRTIKSEFLLQNSSGGSTVHAVTVKKHWVRGTRMGSRMCV